jgi:hypothetical protein
VKDRFLEVPKQTIYRHTDTFQRGSYRFKTERKEIAQGPGGFMF